MKDNLLLESDFSIFFYLSHFIVRAFLIAVLCFMGFIFLFMTICMGDILFHINDSHYSPLFGAYIIVSPSMVPTIKINDAIIIKRVDSDAYHVGDIISFSSEDSNYQGLTITHRIVKKDNINQYESVYTTKGDNNSVVDPFSVKTNSIYGKVLFRIPKIGYVQSFFSNPIYYCIGLFIPIIMFLFYEIIRMVLAMNLKRSKI